MRDDGGQLSEGYRPDLEQIERKPRSKMPEVRREGEGGCLLAESVSFTAAADCAQGNPVVPLHAAYGIVHG